MKYNNKNNSGIMRKSMNLTAQVSDVIKPYSKKGNWKSKTNKFTKTTTGKTITSKPNPMTEDDIDKLFKNHSKDKQKVLGPTKVSTEIPEVYTPFENKNFVNSVKFLRMEDHWDKLLTGIQNCSNQEQKINALFEEQETYDLTSQFKKNYMVGKIIGEGAYASVRVAIYKPLNKKIAIKVYEKGKIKEQQRKKSIRRQIRILELLNHPNIVKIYDVVETNNHLNIVMEYLPGVLLGSFLKTQPNSKISQKNCKIIFKQIIKALKYLHTLNIAHRDLKLENVILDEDLTPKLIDFGFSTCIEESKKVKIFCGTPSYMAPEVVQRKQFKGENADIWACGVLLFVCLTGIFPFKGSTDQELYRKINNAQYPKGQLFFTRNASDLISKMLTIDPVKRITASEILHHSWFKEQKNDSSKKKTTQISFDNRKRVNTMSSNHSKDKKWANKTTNKILAETCKDNLNNQIKKALCSPNKKRQINSYRKVQQKQSTLKVLKSEKNTHRGQGKENKKEKQKMGKTHSKVIDLLRIQIKKRQENHVRIQHKEKSKSRNKNRAI